jgi:hypothetical protein
MIDTFEQLAHLANSPEEFAELRGKLLAQLLANADSRTLPDTQASIDMQRWSVGGGLPSAANMVDTLVNQLSILDNLSTHLDHLLEEAKQRLNENPNTSR